MFSRNLPKLGPSDIFEYNCESLKSVIIPLIRNKFYCDLICAWWDFTTRLAGRKAIENLLSENIWFNQGITFDRKTIYYKKWNQNGIRHINDFLDTSGKLLIYDEFVRKFNIKTNYLEYASVVSSIKKYILLQMISSSEM